MCDESDCLWGRDGEPPHPHPHTHTGTHTCRFVLLSIRIIEETYVQVKENSQVSRLGDRVVQLV